MGYPQDSEKIKKDYATYLNGKRIVIVGPAPHMRGWEQGEKIDSYDIVVRVSKGYEIKGGYEIKDMLEKIKTKYKIDNSLEIDFGSKIDILYQTMFSQWGSGINMPIDKLKNELKWVCASFPDKKHKSMIKEFIKYNNNRIPFHIVGKKQWEKLAKNMETIPSVGSSAMFDLLFYDIKELYITGFTFWQVKDKDGFFYYPEYFYEIKKHLRDDRPKGKHNSKKTFKHFIRSYKNDKRIKCDKILENLIKKYL